MRAGGRILLVLGFALHGVDASAAQDSLKHKGIIRPFAVPEILTPESPPPRPPAPPVEPEALASSAAATLRELKDGIGPEDWRRRHPGDVERLYEPELALVDGAPWCIRFTRRWTIPEGRTITREAFFFLPGMGISNPLSKAPKVEQCGLGAVRLTLTETDTVTGDSLAARLITDLASQFPAVSQAQPTLTRWPERRVGKAWSSGKILVEAAFTARTDLNPSEGKVVAIASFPSALEQDELECLPQCAEYLSPQDEVDSTRSVVRRAVANADVPSSRVAPVFQLLSEVRPPPGSDTVLRVPPSRIVGVLRRWLADSGQLTRRHAATLLVADRLLALSWGSVDPAARKQLTALGAGIEELRYDGRSYRYNSNWRRRAYALDSRGPIGALAMEGMIRDNFFPTSQCRADGYREVLRLAEPYVAGPIGTRSAAAHLALADAYRDMLTLASGGGSESLESVEELLKATPEELGRMRRLALSHYRTAFLLDSTSAQARISRNDAWRIQAGLIPTQTRFACTND